MASLADRSVTAETEDGAFRIVTVRTTDTVSACLRAHGLSGSSAVQLAEVITGTVLIRLAMAPDLRVQTLVRGRDGKGTLVADCHPDGGSRGLARQTSGPVDVGPGSMLQVLRSLPNGELHQGLVEVPEEYGLSGAFMVYMLESEQVTSVVGVGCAMDGARVEAAGGWMVQLMPECAEPPVEALYEHMRAAFHDPAAVLRGCAADPRALLEGILRGTASRTVSECALEHRCRCTSTRVLSSLATLSTADVEDILAKGETLEITCDYCQQAYEVSPESLRGLLDVS